MATVEIIHSEDGDGPVKVIIHHDDGTTAEHTTGGGGE